MLEFIKNLFNKPEKIEYPELFIGLYKCVHCGEYKAIWTTEEEKFKIKCPKCSKLMKFEKFAQWDVDNIPIYKENK